MKMRNIIGLILILLGIGYLFNAFGWLDVNIFRVIHLWYPLLIIFFGFHLLTKKKVVVGGIIILFGIILQLNKIDVIDVNVWQLFIPFALIGFGANLIFSKKEKNRRIADDYNVEKNFEVNNVFSSDYKNINSNSVERGEVFSLFGSTVINMSQATIAESGCNLELDAIFGSVTLELPEDCKLTIKGTPIFGKIDDRSRLNSISTRRVIIDCSCVFGNIEIIN